MDTMIHGLQTGMDATVTRVERLEAKVEELRARVAALEKLHPLQSPQDPVSWQSPKEHPRGWVPVRLQMEAIGWWNEDNGFFDFDFEDYNDLIITGWRSLSEEEQNALDMAEEPILEDYDDEEAG